MSTIELIKTTKNLELRHKTTEALIIAHISEISSRKAHIDLGYSSLFDYVTKELGVAEGAAYMRIQVARASQRFPMILVALSENRINLTIAGKLCPVMTDDNASRLLTMCQGLSSRAVDDLIVTMNLAKRDERKPSMRKASSGPSQGLHPSNAIKDKGEAEKTETTTEDSLTLKDPVLVSLFETPIDEKKDQIPSVPESRYNISLSIDEKIKEKIERLGEVMGFVNATPYLEEILGQALEDALEKRDPKRKAARSARRKGELTPQKGDEEMGLAMESIKENIEASKTSEATEADLNFASEIKLPTEDSRINAAYPEGVMGGAMILPNAEDIFIDFRAHEPTGMGRVIRKEHIPAKVRSEALDRSGYRCEYVAKDGRRCEARSHLEVDHVLAKAHGGKAELSNVQIFCRSHNLRKAELEMGEAFIRGKIFENIKLVSGNGISGHSHLI